MAGRYKLTNPLEVARPKKKKKQTPVPKAVKEEDEDPKPKAPTEVDTSEDSTTERPVLVPVKDKEVMQSIGLLRQYLRDTGLNANMNKFTSILLQSEVLPYNPYPSYIQRFLQASERFHTRREALPKVQSYTSQCPTFVTESGVLSGIKMPNVKLWGLQHVLAASNPKVLTIYRDLAKTITVTQQKVTEKVGDNVSVITLLQGPCIFSGSLYATIFKVDIGVFFLVQASALEDAGRLFGHAVLCDVSHVLRDTDQHILSLHVPASEDKALQKSTWTGDELHPLLSSATSQSRNDLVHAIGNAALQRRSCSLLLLVHCDENSSVLKTKYIRVEKTYDMMLLLRNSSAGSQASFHTSSTPYFALHGGIFIEQSESELYLSALKQYSGSKAPMLPKVTSAVESSWQSVIAGRHLESDFMLVVHYLWLIEKIQGQAKVATSKTEESLGIQISRILQGNGVKLESISMILTMLYQITASKISSSHPQVFTEVLNLCVACFQDYFNEESRELTMLFAKPVLTHVLSTIEDLAAGKKFEQAQSQLNFLKGYLKVLSISLLDDALKEYPRITSAFSQINKKCKTEFGMNLNVDTRANAYRHSFESSSFTDIDRKQIDVSASASNFAGPPKVSQQASRMQYCIDMRIDEVWKEFLSDLFVTRGSLPPNPYPSLIRHLRQASLKVLLQREESSNIVRKLLSSKPKIHDESLHIYSVPGIHAYGLFCAVAPLNLVGFRQVSAMVATVSISPPKSNSGSQLIKAGAFEIKCLTAISGEALLYGSACPYLTSIRNEEYCFIKGPKTQESDGILAFAKILLIYLGNLQSQGIMTIKANFHGSEIELYDLSAATARFQSQFTSLRNSREPVILHLLIPLDWRYVLIEKIIHVCYIDEMDDSATFVTNYDVMAPFNQVFLNGPDASEFARRTGTFKAGAAALKQSIKEAYVKYQWAAIARLSLCLPLQAKSIEAFDEEALECVGLSWKLYHSPYGTLHYCQALNEALSCGFKYKALGPPGSETDERLTTMLFGYRNCLHLVLNSRSTMCSLSIDLYCQNLLQHTAPCDLPSGTAVVSTEGRLPTVLLHLNSMTQALADSLALDVLHCVPPVLQLISESAKKHG